jgi:hypothetical protein
MAVTSVPTNSRVIAWEREYFREYIRANRFSKYIGNSETSIIQANEDLTKKVSEQVNFSLVNRLNGNQNTATGAVSGVVSGITGYNRLKGNEEAVSVRNFRVTVNRTRWAVAHDTLDDQFSSIDLADAKRATLMDWSKENIRDRIVTALGSISTDGVTHTAYASATAGNRNTWLVNNADRVSFGASNSAAGFTTLATDIAQCDTTNDLFTAANLQILKDVAKSANPKIKPIKVNDEEEYYVCFCGTKLFRALQTSLATLNQALIQGGESRKDNPIFTSGDLMYDGIVIREIPEIANLGAVGAASANVGVAYLCGAQAIAYAIAQRQKVISDTDDYGSYVGVGTQMIDGIAKFYYGSGASDTTTPKQNGVATGFFAYV